MIVQTELLTDLTAAQQYDINTSKELHTQLVCGWVGVCHCVRVIVCVCVCVDWGDKVYVYRLCKRSCSNSSVDRSKGRGVMWGWWPAGRTSSLCCPTPTVFLQLTHAAAADTSRCVSQVTGNTDREDSTHCWPMNWEMKITVSLRVPLYFLLRIKKRQNLTFLQAETLKLFLTRLPLEFSSGDTILWAIKHQNTVKTAHHNLETKPKASTYI